MEEKELMIAAMDKAFKDRRNACDRSAYLSGLIGLYEALIKALTVHQMDHAMVTEALNNFITKHTPEN